MASNTNPQSSANGEADLDRITIASQFGSETPPEKPVVNDDNPPNPDPPTTDNEGTTTPDPQAEFLGGHGFDQNGNLVDSKGKVILMASLAKDRLKAYKAPEEKPKEGDDAAPVSATLNEAGDLVDVDGNVLYRKGEFSIDKDGQVQVNETSVIEDLINRAVQSGIDLTDETGNRMEFPDTTEGVYDFAGHLASKYFEQIRDKFFEDNPELTALWRHVNAGGQPEDFYKTRATRVDYKKLDVPENNKSGRLNVIQQYLTMVAKNNEATASKFVKFIEDSGEVNQQYEEAITGLRQWQEEQEQSEAAAASAAQEARRNEQIQYWKGIESTIMGNKIEGLSLPAAEQKEFFAYLKDPVKDGKSQRAIDFENLPIEQRLKFEYFLYKGMNPAAIAAVAKATANAEKTLSRVKKGNPIVVSNIEQTTKPADIRKINMNTIR